MTTRTELDYMSMTTDRIVESVGTLLRDARLESGHTLHEVSLKTKIPEKYLAMFEADAHDGMSDDVYAKIYLKAYGKFLGFETGALLDHYRKERARLGVPVRSIESRTDRHPTREVTRKALSVTPKVLQTALLAAVAIGLLGWFGSELKKIVAAPVITIASPQDGFVTYDRSITVEGTTERESSLVINGKPVSPDAEGKFRDTLNLQEGLNTITVTGSKKHSKEMSLTRRVIVLPKSEATMEAGSVLIEEVPAEGAAVTTPVVKPAAVTPKPAAQPTPSPAATEPVTQPEPSAPATDNPLNIQF